MKRLLVLLICVVALTAVCSSSLAGPKIVVHKKHADALKEAQETWRPIVAAFVTSRDAGLLADVLGDQSVAKLVTYVVRIQVDFVPAKSGKKDSVEPSEKENNKFVQSVIPEGKIPTLAIVGPDGKLIRKWEPAHDTAEIKKAIGNIIKGAVKRYKSLSYKKVKSIKNYFERAEKEIARDKLEKAIKYLEKIVKMHENATLCKKAQEKIEELQEKLKKQEEEKKKDEEKKDDEKKDGEKKDNGDEKKTPFGPKGD